MQGCALHTLDLLQQIVDHAILILESHFHVVSLGLKLTFLDSFKRAISLFRLKRVIEAALNYWQTLSNIQDRNLAKCR